MITQQQIIEQEQNAAAVLAVMTHEPQTKADIIQRSGLRLKAATSALDTLHNAGKIERLHAGGYALPKESGALLANLQAVFENFIRSQRATPCAA